MMASKTDVEFIFDLFSTKTLIGTNYILYHLNVCSFLGDGGFVVLVFFFLFLPTYKLDRCCLNLSLLRCCRELVLIPSSKIFNINPLLIM